MTPRRPVRRYQAHPEEFIGYINPNGSRDGNWAAPVESDESSFVAALFVLLLCFAALIAWLYIAAAAQ